MHIQTHPCVFERFSSYLPIGLSSSEPEPEAEENMAGWICKSLELSYTNRLYGFAICFGLGCLLSLMSSFALLHPTKVRF
jgi:hypothetical protein